MPSWAEVQNISPLELEAIAIIKGESQGDEYLWDRTYFEPRAGEKDEDGQPLGAEVTGGWRSRIEHLEKSKGP